MRNMTFGLLSIATLAMITSSAIAQPPGGPGRGRPGGEGPPSAEQFIARIMEFDKNKDGKLSKDEVPERMARMIDQHDENEDGALDKSELKKVAAEMAQRRGRRGPEGEGRRGPGGPEGRRGPPTPEQFVEHAMEFDADEDGKLSKEELLKFAQEMVQRGPGRGPEAGGRPGGRGGRPEGDRGERGGRPERERPSRPEAE